MTCLISFGFHLRVGCCRLGWTIERESTPRCQCAEVKAALASFIMRGSSDSRCAGTRRRFYINATLTTTRHDLQIVRHLQSACGGRSLSLHQASSSSSKVFPKRSEVQSGSDILAGSCYDPEDMVTTWEWSLRTKKTLWSTKSFVDYLCGTRPTVPLHSILRAVL